MVEIKKFKLMANKYIPAKILKLMYGHEEHKDVSNRYERRRREETI